MKKHFIYILFCILGCKSSIDSTLNDEKVIIHSVLSQVDDNYLLKSYTWKLLNTEENFEFTFSENKLTTYLDGIVIGGKPEYYLTSDTCEQIKFDKNKVGMNSKGKYLITENKCYMLRFINKRKIELTPNINSPNPDVLILEAQ